MWNLHQQEDAMAKRRNSKERLPEQVAGNGLLHRRFFLQSGRRGGAAAALGTAQAASVGEAARPGC
jgi:hypothetical protein